MAIFDGCLIASDVDGTLMDNGYINPKTVERIKFFMSQGGKFSLSTGRCSSAVGDVLAHILPSPSVAANGAVIYDYENKKYLYSIGLEEKDKILAKLIKENFSTVGIEIHSKDNILLLNETKETVDHETYEHLTAKKVDFKESLLYQWNKVLYLCENEEQRKRVESFALNAKIGSDFARTVAVIDNKTRYYFEQVPKNISKATTLKKLCEMLDIKKGKFFAIGDYYNDLEMLKSADISACPENSPEDIKQYAKTIVSTAENGAVADFIDYLYVLLTPKKKGN